MNVCLLRQLTIFQCTNFFLLLSWTRQYIESNRKEGRKRMKKEEREGGREERENKEKEEGKSPVMRIGMS